MYQMTVRKYYFNYKLKKTMGKLIYQLEKLRDEYLSMMEYYKHDDISLYYKGKAEGVKEALKLIDKYR